MTRGLMLAAAAVAALSLAGCNKKADTPNSSPGQTEPVNAAQDAVGAAVGATSAATLGSHDTGAFVSNASQSDMYEIQAGQMASTMAKNPDVKKFGKQMVTDHTALMNEMKPLVAAAGQQPATSLDQRRQGFLDNLKSSKNFDKDYIDQQVAAHQEAVTLMQGYSENGDDAGLKGGAAKALPKIQMHLQMAQQLQSKLSGDTSGASGNSGGATPAKK